MSHHRRTVRLPCGGVPDSVERAVYRGLLLFAATMAALWAFGLILWPFLVPIAWALCLFAVTARPYRWLTAKWRKPRLVAGLFVLLTAAVVLGPMIYIGAMFVDQAASIDFGPSYERLQKEGPGAIEWANQTLSYFELGQLETFIEDLQKGLPGLAKHIFSGSTVSGALGVLLSPFVFIFGLVVALVTQYFLYRESKRLLLAVTSISPLDAEDTARILDTLRGATVSAIVGGLLVAIIQGALGTLMFIIAGIQSPVLWGVIMAAFSLLPFGGTALIWAPAGIYLLFTGDASSGWFVLVFGAVIVGSADNVLRPLVLTRIGGEGIDIHPLMLFFAILSGVGLFGVSGIVFGPLLIALLTTVLRIYREHVHAGDEPAGEAS